MTRKCIPERLPKVTVVIPMMNEESYIGRCLESVVEQDYRAELVEILVVDGGSNDGSTEIVRRYSQQHLNVHLLGGSGVNCPAAMNIGVKNSTGQFIAKVDAHGYVAKDYLSKSVKYLIENEDIKCVGGPIRPVPETITGKANALARSSRFGVGRGVYSVKHGIEFVDTVQCGVYRKDVLEEVGLFDESLQFGEDEEVNWRLRKMGYKIVVTPEIRFFYFPRKTFKRLFRQYFNYGMLRVEVIKKHSDFLRTKHLVPAAFVLTLVLTIVLTPLGVVPASLFVGTLSLYAGVSIFFSLAIGASQGWRCLWRLPVSFAALHFGYGLGFLIGTARSVIAGQKKIAMV
jgi:glycosyltransferase involved in cell wall biosynthesis